MGTQVSGKPFIREYTATTTAQTVYPPVSTSYVQIRNEGAVVVNVYFDSADQVAGQNELPLAATGSSGDYFEGPASLIPTADANSPTRGGITLVAASATAVVRVVYYKA